MAWHQRLITSTMALLLATATVLGTTLVPGVAGAATQAAPEVGLQYYGAQVHLLWDSNTQVNVDTELDLLQEAGANSTRVDVAWSSLEIHGPGQYSSSYTARLDAVVDGAVRRGIAPVLTLFTTPCWASSAPDDLKQSCTGAYWDRGVTRYPPKDYGDFARAARWVAQRYAGRIAALELWNEPNYVEEGTTPLISNDQAQTYTGMVKAAYPAIKAVAPELPVLAGAMSFADDVFLNALYGYGIKGYYDGISVHPYNEWRAPGAAQDPLWYKYDYVLGLEALRRAMTAAGDSSPVWVTEVGWTTCAAGSGRWCVTREQQAQFTEMLLPLTTQRFPWVRAVLLYNLRDKGRDPSWPEDNFGLVDRDYNRKPGFAAASRAFRAVGVGTAPAPAPSPPDPTAPATPTPAFQVVACPFAVPATAGIVLCDQPQVLTR